ncbi:MAG: LysE family translocator [Ostreibacterium sp.]
MFDAINPVILVAFVPTFLFVSITPGLCMTLAMTMGMTIGFRRTLWMMMGELAGVGLVAILTVIGGATMILKYPSIFHVLKYAGGMYLMYIGINMWLSRGKMVLSMDKKVRILSSRITLMAQGFMTAISNPKGWAFFIALLPPFIDTTKPMVWQLIILISFILLIEFSCLCFYCGGGRAMRQFLQDATNVRLLNRIAGTLMIGVAVWLAFG